MFNECRNVSFVCFISVAFVGERDDNTEGRICADSFEPDISIAEREMGFCLDFSCIREEVTEALMDDACVSALGTVNQDEELDPFDESETLAMDC